MDSKSKGFFFSKKTKISCYLRPMDPAEEVEYCLQQIERYETHFRHYNCYLVPPGESPYNRARSGQYILQYPNDPHLLPYLNGQISLAELDMEHIKQTVIGEYDPHFYVAGLQNLTACMPTVEAGLRRLQQFINRQPLKGKGVFKRPEQVTLLLTRYGNGGSFDVERNLVVMMTNRQGKFNPNRKSPQEIALHEIVHLILSPLVYSVNHLDFQEIERLVDKICLLLFGSGENPLLPGYIIQKIGNSQIQELVTQTSINDIGATVSKYLRNK